VGHFERKFQGEGGHPLTNFGVRKIVTRLSCGVVCVILRLAVLIQYRRRVTHRQTHKQTRDLQFCTIRGGLEVRQLATI